MADCHKLFEAFNKEIWFDKDAMDELRTSRDAIRKKIKKTFEDKDVYNPEFVGQGSFKMETITRRISGNHDVDDGIYFIVSEQPQKSVATIQGWIHDAVDDHTTLETQERKNCVRVQFKNSYHIDLPIYYEIDGECPKLGYKSGQWKDSDPVAFVEWFDKKTSDTDGQLRRLIRYSKAWVDHRNRNGDFKSSNLLKGVMLTILVAENYQKNDRDDLAFLNTIKKIKKNLDNEFICNRPTTPSEDLFSQFDDEDKNGVLDAFNFLIEKGDQAIEVELQHDACLKWRKVFGNRFSCDNASKSLDESIRFANPVILTTDSRSA